MNDVKPESSPGIPTDMGTTPWRRFRDHLSREAQRHGPAEAFFRLYLAAFCLAVFAFALARPIMNWDMLAYVGSAKAWETGDPQLLHDHVYGQLHYYLDAQTYDELTQSSPYRRNMLEDPKGFAQSLPWYQVRVTYTGLIHLLEQAGINPFFASHLISALAVFAGIFVFYLAFRDHITGFFWYALPFTLLMNGTIQSARLATADGLAFLATALLSLLFLRSSRWLYALLPLAMLVRTDLIFVVGLMLGYRFLVARKERVLAVASLLVTLLIYQLLNQHFGYYGWKSLFYLVFVTDYGMHYPADTTPVVGLADYLGALPTGLMKLVESDAFAAFAAIFVMQLAVMFRLDGLRGAAIRFLREPLFALSAIGVVYVGVHFLVFPLGIPRFFIAQYTTGLLVFLALLTSLCRRIDPRERARHMLLNERRHD
ncbi:hypothetical protein Q4485_04870 [Granulosicoccaceae sp. 1_MG-2023]|nr:hypothetical protein [Granulosicoccaceae sp. 1_MG-2023]